MCERVVVSAPSPQQSSASIGGGCICSSDRTEEIVFSSLMKIRREEEKKKGKLLRKANDQALCFLFSNFILVYLLFCLRVCFFLNLHMFAVYFAPTF